MLVERNLQVMNVAVIRNAYSIAANYLGRSGAMTTNPTPDSRLLGIIVSMVHCGETNKIRLANKAITEFENTRVEWA